MADSDRGLAAVLSYEIAQTPTSTSPPTIASPPAVLEWGMAISLSVAAATWLGKNLWSYFTAKEADESSLLKTLIADLQASQRQLLTDNKAAQQDLIAQIALKESLSITQQDVNRALSSQAALYTTAVQTLTRLEAKVDAVHRRLDEISDSTK